MIVCQCVVAIVITVVISIIVCYVRQENMIMSVSASCSLFCVPNSLFLFSLLNHWMTMEIPACYDQWYIFAFIYIYIFIYYILVVPVN